MNMEMAMALALTMSTSDAAPTYQECRQQALEQNKPLMVWISGTGKPFCPECIEASPTGQEFIHSFLTRKEAEEIGFQVTADEQVIVAVKEGDSLIGIGDMTWWEDGKPGERHLRSARGALARWRQSRQMTRQNAAPQQEAMFQYPQDMQGYQPMMGQSQPQPMMMRGRMMMGQPMMGSGGNCSSGSCR